MLEQHSIDTYIPLYEEREEHTARNRERDREKHIHMRFCIYCIDSCIICFTYALHRLILCVAISRFTIESFEGV